MELRLAQLPAKQRSVLLPRFTADLSYHEIADLLDMPIGTVRSRIFEGLGRNATHGGGVMSSRSGRLAAHLAGATDAQEQRLIEAPLRDNSTTRERLEQLRQLRDTLAAPVPEVEARTDLLPRVHAASGARGG